MAECPTDEQTRKMASSLQRLTMNSGKVYWSGLRQLSRSVWSRASERLSKLDRFSIFTRIFPVSCLLSNNEMLYRYAITDMRKLANRMQFGIPEESSLGDGLGEGYGMLGQAGNEKLRVSGSEQACC